MQKFFLIFSLEKKFSGRSFNEIISDTFINPKFSAITTYEIFEIFKFLKWQAIVYIEIKILKIYNFFNRHNLNKIEITIL